MDRHCGHRRSACPIVYALDIFGDRWSLLVLRDLLFFGKRRFGELATSDEQIASNILADRLRKLEANGLIHRDRDPGDRRQVIYRPTGKGKDLGPALLEIIRWSVRHDSETAAPPDMVERIEADRDAVLRELLGSDR